MSLLQIVVITLHRDYMSLSNFPRKLWLQEDSNGASLIFKPLEPNTVLYIQTEAKLTVDFNDWMKEKEYNASAFSLKSRCIADAQGLGVPSQAQWFVFFVVVVFFLFHCVVPPSHLHIYSSLGCLLVAKETWLIFHLTGPGFARPEPWNLIVLYIPLSYLLF